MKITSKRKIILIIILSFGLVTAKGAQVYTEPHDGHSAREKGFHERLPGIRDVSTQVQGKVNILQ